MKLFIPGVGTQIRLRKDTCVSLKNAAQNTRFVEAVTGQAIPLKGKSVNVTLPKGLVLTVDRVYIRQGQGADYNSLTFKVNAHESGIPKGRFFLPVAAVNTLDVDIVLAAPEKRHDHNVRTLLAQYAKELNVTARVNKEHVDALMDEIMTYPPECEGVVLVNARKEYHRFTDSLRDAMTNLGVNDPADLYRTLRTVLKGEESEALEEYIKDIASLNQQFEHVLSHGDETELYHFKLLQVGREPALMLTPKESMLIDTMAALDDKYSMLGKVYRREFDTSKKRQLHSSIGLTGLHDHLISGREGSNTFGYHHYKHNHNPNAPIVNASRTCGVIPMDAFGDNLLTRTRNVGYGYVFTYLTDQDQRLSVSQLRKRMKMMVSEA